MIEKVHILLFTGRAGKTYKLSMKHQTHPRYSTRTLLNKKKLVPLASHHIEFTLPLMFGVMLMTQNFPFDCLLIIRALILCCCSLWMKPTSGSNDFLQLNRRKHHEPHHTLTELYLYNASSSKISINIGPFYISLHKKITLKRTVICSIFNKAARDVLFYSPE